MRAARASTDNGLQTVSTLAVRATSTSGIDLDRQGRHSRRYVFGRDGNPPVTGGGNLPVEPQIQSLCSASVSFGHPST